MKMAVGMAERETEIYTAVPLYERFRSAPSTRVEHMDYVQLDFSLNIQNHPKHIPVGTLCIWFSFTLLDVHFMYDVRTDLYLY